MALTLAECLHEARNIQCFNGTDDYNLNSFLRDVESVLSLTNPIYHEHIKPVLANRIRGKALKCIKFLVSPTYDEIFNKLKEDFGVKETFFSLRNKATNVSAANIEELHSKLSQILHLMNTKFKLEGSVNNLYMPMTNEKMIFDIYLNFLPCHIKTLLLQNNIQTIKSAYSYYVENDILNDIVLVSKFKSGNEKQNENKNTHEKYKNSSHLQNNNNNRAPLVTNQE